MSPSSQIFFRLAEEYSLRLSPLNGLVEQHSKAPMSGASLEFEISRLGCGVLVACDGKRDLQAVLCWLAKEMGAPFETLVKDVPEFLVEAVERGVVAARGEAWSTAPNIRGGSTHFSPRHVTIELTDGCNLSCRHCYRYSSPSQAAYLSAAELGRIFHELVEEGVTGVELTGGEATTHPEFAEVLAAALDAFGAVALLTNGREIREEAVDLLAANKDKSGVQIDIDGPNAKVHDWLRGKGAFGSAVATARLFIERGIRTRLAMNVHERNLSYCEEVLLFARCLGATSFALSPILEMGRASGAPWVLRADSLAQFQAYYQTFSAKYPGFFQAPSEEETQRFLDPTKNCGAGWRGLVLGPTGNLRPCVVLPEESMTLGNLRNMPYKQALLAAASTQLALHDAPTPSPVSCGSCSSLPYCTGCLVRPFLAASLAPLECAWARGTELDRHFSRPLSQKRAN
jgi:radical SAM protein with 4Fe4S-binding SPASM domain